MNNRSRSRSKPFNHSSPSLAFKTSRLHKVCVPSELLYGQPEISPTYALHLRFLTSIVTEKSIVKISNCLMQMLMMTVADANQNGYVLYDEFEKVLRSNKDGSGGVMEDVFKAMDGDDDGKVGYGDLRSYLLSARFEVNDDEIKAMIRLGGVDGDTDGVTFEGFFKDTGRLIIQLVTMAYVF